MSHTTQKELRKARPNLKLMSPLAHWTVMVMAVFNLFLGASLMFLFDADKFSAPLLIVNSVLTYKFWGVVFLVLGFIKLYSIIYNNWRVARISLFIGVSIKAAWAVDLIIRVLTTPGTFFLTLCWVTIALLQMGAYIWFMPQELTRGERRA